MASDSIAKSVICLTVFVVINAAAFVIVTVIQCNNIRHLEAVDADLESDLDELFSTASDGSADVEVELTSAVRRALVKTVQSKDRNKRSGLGDIFMDLLKTQESIIEQHCQDTTKICKQGDKGDGGPAGDRGQKGDRGAPGAKGVRGYQGRKGIKGPHGPAGDAGPKGATGLAGPKGTAGARGDNGTMGAKGVKGSKGDPGIPGAKGDKGEPGLRGPPGQAGLSGDPGPKGAKGERGPPGVMGTKGDPGRRGADRDKLNVGCECLKEPTIAGPDNQIITAAAGSAVTMQCNASGIPVPNVTWNTKAQGSTYSIPTVTLYDYRTYQCTASNVFGTDTKNITLRH